MSGNEDDTEKPFEPTPHKLAEARKKGDIPKSQDVNTTASYFGLFLAISFLSYGALWEAMSAATTLLDRPTELSTLIFQGNPQPVFMQFAFHLSNFLVLLFATPIVMVVLSVIVQRSVTFAPSKIAPKLNRISPIQTAKQKYGVSGLLNS